MIIYQATKKQFLHDAGHNIADIIWHALATKFNHRVEINGSEHNAWKNSLGNDVYHLLNSNLIPDDVIIAIEYVIPKSSNRIDLMIIGHDASNRPIIIIIELKQWTRIEFSEKNDAVNVHYGNRLVECNHPSYQAWSYSMFFEYFSEEIEKKNVKLLPCAFLHNMVDESVISDSRYSNYINKAPIFLKNDRDKLRDFICKYIKHGDNNDTLYEIEHGRVRPSKELADRISSMMKGNKEFILIDDQKLIYEEALIRIRKSNKKKQVYIIEGGPGTGKSVVAINLLTTLNQRQLLANYVTKNATPRDVYEAKLTNTLSKSEFSNLFKSSGAYINSSTDEFDALIVDEAHRLNEKSGIYRNKGENQIKELINASKCSIFFIDEDQQVTWQDIGEISEIKKWAEFYGAEIKIDSLKTQFRCNGSNGYLAWLNHNLQIKETANPLLTKGEYNFQVFDNPEELRKMIVSLNVNNKARLTAGYCWDWVSKKNKKAYDIVFPEFDFKMQWNLTEDGPAYAIMENSVNQIGCIHTTQGLDFEYIGVIIGPDLIVRNGKVITNPGARSNMDKSLSGFKKAFDHNPEAALKKADKIIKNTYRTLMSRGLKGCFIYCTDQETNEYFKNLVR